VVGRLRQVGGRCVEMRGVGVWGWWWGWGGGGGVVKGPRTQRTVALVREQSLPPERLGRDRGHWALAFGADGTMFGHGRRFWGRLGPGWSVREAELVRGVLSGCGVRLVLGTVLRGGGHKMCECGWPSNHV